MSSFVIDTSVAVAWYLTESFSTAARRWQKQLLSGSVTIYVPELHYLEFANVLRTYVRRGELSQELAEEVYRTHLIAPLKTARMDLGTVLQIAFEYETTCYDATFIALALALDAPIITAERTTTPWVVKLRNLVESVH